MLRILYIARHFHLRMEGIVAAMATVPDVAVTLICPTQWHDELGLSHPDEAVPRNHDRIKLPMIGPPNDYHRAIYRSTRFHLKTLQPHIIHAEEEPESLAAVQIAAARYLCAPHAKLILNAWQNVDRFKRWYVWWVARVAFRAADAITCGNQGAVTVLRRMGYKGITAVIPQKGVDTDIYQPWERLNEPNGGLRVLYAGRLLPEKDVETLIRAVSLVSETTTLRIVGDGPHRDTLLDMIHARDLGQRVTVEPSIAPNELPSVFASVDVLVLPSKSMPFWNEQLGRILLEAMACELPVIGSDSGAIPEVVGDAGLIFQEGSPQALAGCIRQLERSEEVRSSLARLGRARVERYSNGYLAKQNLLLYRKVLASKG